MWKRIALFIIKNRLPLIILIALGTAFMAYKAKDVEMSYDFAKVVSPDDPDMIYFNQFRQTFGEDGNMLVIGMQDSSVFQLENFRKLKALTDSISQVDGVNGMMSLANLIRIEKDTARRSFTTSPIFKTFPESERELDSLMQVVHDQKFFQGQLLNERTGATLMAISIDPEVVNSARREAVMEEILKKAYQFEKDTDIELHYAGLPFVRSTMTTKVAAEMKFFLMLALVVTAATLFIFFRSFYAVIFPLLIIGVVVIWVMGTLALLGFKISLLTALLPSIIVVIGIPNSIYLITRYHYDFRKHGNKILALARVISKLGIVTLITNTTTAIGFAVFCFTHIAILYEFGLVASINIFVTFFISIILITAVFSYLPAPNQRQLKHLKARPLNKLLEFFDSIVHRKRQLVYIFTGLIVALSLYGVTKVNSVSYMVDDLPEESSVNSDLKFFEQHFGGVMPLEVVIDTGTKRGIQKLSNLRKIEAFENYMRTQPILSAPISLVSFVKASKQAFYNNNPDYYNLPDNSERNFILSYLSRQEQGGMQSRLMNSFVDSTGQVARISLKVADVGSRELDTLLIKKLKPKIKEIFGGEGITVKEEGNTLTFTDENENYSSVSLTGTTLLFIKGNEYLINNLQSSLLLAFVLISIIIAVLFRSVRIVIISIIPNLIPLIIAGGLMGLFNIPLKPSTALIFSIALGIAVDDSIHYLAKYRHELHTNGFNVSRAITTALNEAGTSMIYTSIILFFGFVIFAFSEFGGTKALGILMSFSLLLAMLSNLIVLPTLLMTFDSGKYAKYQDVVLDQYDEDYLEHEDEEIDLELLELKKEE